MENKIDGTHYLLMYLTGYGFYSYQIYTQLLYSFHGLDLLIPFSISFLLLPIFVFYVCKKINSNKTLEHKTNFVFTILTILYLSIVTLLSLNYASVMVHNYYYQSTKSYIISLFF